MRTTTSVRRNVRDDRNFKKVLGFTSNNPYYMNFSLKKWQKLVRGDFFFHRKAPIFSFNLKKAFILIFFPVKLP